MFGRAVRPLISPAFPVVWVVVWVPNLSLAHVPVGSSPPLFLAALLFDTAPRTKNRISKKYSDFRSLVRDLSKVAAHHDKGQSRTNKPSKGHNSEQSLSAQSHQMLNCAEILHRLIESQHFSYLRKVRWYEENISLPCVTVNSILSLLPTNVL